MEHILKYILEHFIFSPFLEHYPERISKRIMEHNFLQNTFCHAFWNAFRNAFWNAFQNTLWNAKTTHCGTLKNTLWNAKKHTAERFADHIRNGTVCSKVVTLPSTDRDRCCLTLIDDCTRTGTLNLVRMLAVCKNVVLYIKFKLFNYLKFYQLVVNNA